MTLILINNTPWFIFGALCVLLVIILYRLFTHKSLSIKQRVIKTGLNVLLWSVLLLWSLNPTWHSENINTGMVVFGAQVPDEIIQKTKDSLNLTRSIPYAAFEKDFDDYKQDELNFLGAAPTSEMLSKLGGKNIHRLPYFSTNTVQKMHYQAIVRRGDLQKISGNIELTEPATLRLVYADKTLDSVRLDKGFRAFSLKFPVFSVGRSEVILQLNTGELQKINFFGTASPSLAVNMLLSHPDFESRTLAEWLGTQGSSVEIQTQVARDNFHQTSVNKKKSTGDLFVTSTDFASDRRIRQAVENGKSVLFLGLHKVEDDLRLINNSLGTRFSGKRISNNESVPAGKDLTALPYGLNPAANQRTSPVLPVGFQRTSGKVGVSLLNETYPLRLSGDSVAYVQMWNEILQFLRPADTSALKVTGPVFKDVPYLLRSYGYSDVRTEEDTLAFKTSTVNPEKKEASHIFRKEGWQTMNDSTEVFVETNPDAYFEHWIGINKDDSAFREEQTPDKEVPDWLWFVLIVIVLTALWIEPKLNY